MSEPSSFHAFHPGREREARDTEDRFSNHLAYTFRHVEELEEALRDNLDFKRLAPICKLATSDPAEAGEQLRKLVIEAAHEHARYSAHAEEVVPPIGGWKPTQPVSLLPMVADICRPLGAASVSANAAPSELSVVASGAEQKDEPARLRETGAI